MESPSISPLSYNLTVTSWSFTISDFINSLLLSFRIAGTFTTGLVVIFVNGRFTLLVVSGFISGLVLATIFVAGLSAGFVRGVTGCFLATGGFTFFTIESAGGCV